MTSEIELELFRQYRTHQQKYIYFLLAADVACVALSVKRTTSMPLQWAMIPLGLATICWMVSFWAGCRMLREHGSALLNNIQLIRVNKGTHPGAGTNPEAQRIGREKLEQFIERSGASAVLLGKAQFILLVAGALFYVAWHITEMALGGSTVPPES